MMTSIPILDMTGWSILDFELAYAGLTGMADGGQSVLLQPRAMADGQTFIPGAAFVYDAVADWVDWRTGDLIERLKTIRFPDPDHDERRVKMLLRFEIDCAEMSVAELIAMALAQSLRKAA
jgi:hypothetical protein